VAFGLDASLKAGSAEPWIATGGVEQAAPVVAVAASDASPPYATTWYLYTCSSKSAPRCIS
jgi:hypothetical protein